MGREPIRPAAPLILLPVDENAGPASHERASIPRPQHCPSEKEKVVLFFSRCSPPRRLAGGAGAFDGRGAQKFGGKRKFLCPARKSLFFHKMNEGIFGNIWRKGAQIWKCLAWACKGLHGPRAGEGDGALSRARAPRIARATRTIRTEALSRRRFRSSWSAGRKRRSNGSPRTFPTRGRRSCRRAPTDSADGSRGSPTATASHGA